jgi:membrane fusion protein (multidrug efflux system)
MNAIRRLFITACLFAAAGAAFWYGWRSWDSHSGVQSTQDAYVRGEITTLSPRVSGYAVAILFDENERVEAKQTVVRIDPRDYRAAVQRAQASLEQSNAVLEQSRAKLDLQASQIEVAKATLRSAEAQAQNADITFGRARELLSKGAGTQATFDQTYAANVSAKSSVEQAQSQLAYQNQQLAVMSADVRVAETKAADSQSALDTSKLALEDTEVWAPLAGTVANRRTRVGEYVTVGTRMLSIVPDTGLWIDANFRETQLAHMKPDQSVAIALDTYGEKHVCGYVESVGQAASSEFALVPPDNATGNFTKITRRFAVRIRANLSDPNLALLRPGMSAEIKVAVDASEIAGCKFVPAKDRQPRSIPKLPARSGL